MTYLGILQDSVRTAPFWAGFLLVFLFAINRFRISEKREDTFDPPTPMRSFTTRFRYWLGATVYAGFYEFIFFILVGIGAMPFLQKILTEWLGSLDIQGSSAQIGTPMWAALAATSLFPSVKGFTFVDERVRSFLRDFCSIPRKARRIAEEIEAGIWRACDVGDDEEEEKDEPEILVKKRLRELVCIHEAIHRFTSPDHNEKNADSYGDFVNKHRAFYEDLKAKEGQLRDLARSKSAAPSYLAGELTALVGRLSRLLSCALLFAESSEVDIRHRLRKDLKLTSIPEIRFSFNLMQVVVAIFVLAIVTFVTGAILLWIGVSWFGDPTKIVPLKILKIAAIWVPYTITLFVPSFVLAAGVRFYFEDRRAYWGDRIPPEEHFVGVCLLLIGATGLAALPLLAAASLSPRVASLAFESVLVFALPPAVAALCFYGLGYVPARASRFLTASRDFASFAVIIGLVTFGVTWLSLLMGLPKYSGFTEAALLFTNPMSAAIIGGALGTVQLAISRHLKA